MHYKRYNDTRTAYKLQNGTSAIYSERSGRATMKKPTGASLRPSPAPSAARRQHAQNFLSISGPEKNFSALAEGYKCDFMMFLVEVGKNFFGWY